MVKETILAGNMLEGGPHIVRHIKITRSTYHVLYHPAVLRALAQGKAEAARLSERRGADSIAPDQFSGLSRGGDQGGM